MPAGSFAESMQANADRWASLAAASRNKNTLSLAKNLLSNADVANYQGGKGAAVDVNPGGNNESPFGRLMDLLTTPLAAVAGLGKGLIHESQNAASGDGFNPLSALAEIPKAVGANLYSFKSGEPNIEAKASWLKNLEDINAGQNAESVGLKANQGAEFNAKYNGGELNPALRGVAFGLDIATDPLTYATGGISAFSKAGKLAKSGEEAAALTKVGDAANVAREAITASPESIADGGQLVLPGTHVPSVAPRPSLSTPGVRGEIPAGDYQLPGQLNLPGMTGRMTAPKAAAQQGSLFGPEAVGGRVATDTAVAAKAGKEISSVDPALFNFNPNPKVAGMVPNIAAYPGKVAKAAEVAATAAPVAKTVEKAAVDVIQALAPVMEKAGVSADAIVQTIDAAKLRAVSDIPLFNEVAAPAIATAEKFNPQKAVADKIAEVFGVPFSTDGKILAESGNMTSPAVNNISMVSIAKAIAKNNIGSLKGLRFPMANGKHKTIETLVSEVRGHVKNLSDSAAKGTGATGGVVKDVNQAAVAAMKDAGLSEAQIKRVLTGGKKVIDSLAKSAESRAKSSTVEAIASDVAKPVADVTPTAENVIQGLAESKQQIVEANAAITEIATHHPKLAQEVVHITEERVKKIAADKRLSPTPEVAKQQLESLGVTQSVPHPKGVTRANPNHQTQMFREIMIKAAKRNVPKPGGKVTEAIVQERASLGYRSLQAAEEHLKTLGAPPLAFHGRDSAFRLSEFLAATAHDLGTSVEDLITRLGFVPFGPGVKAVDKELADTVNRALTEGRNAGLDHMAAHYPTVKLYLENGAKVQAAIDATIAPKVMAETSDLLALADHAKGTQLATDAQDLQTAVHDIPAVAEDLTARAGGSDAVGQHVIDEMQTKVLGTPDTAAVGAVSKNAASSTRKAEIGDATVGQHADALKAIDAETITGTGTMARIMNTENRFMRNMCAWYGYKDLYPMHMMKVQGAAAVSNFMMHVYGDTVKTLGLTPEVMSNAWKFLRGDVGLAAATEQESKAVQFITSRLDNALKDVTVSKPFQKGTSVVTRSGITMDELNNELKVSGIDFRFHVPETGSSDWTQSWRAYQGKVDPMDFALKVESAVNRAAMRKNIYADLRYNFHTPNGVKVEGIPQLADATFTPEIAKQIHVMLGKLDETFAPSGQFGKAIDTFLASWKTGVTIYNPSHHIRNVIGDLFFAWLAGVPVGNPVLIAKMTKVMRAQKSFYKDINPDAGLNDLISSMRSGHAAEANILNKAASPSDVISQFLTKDGKAVKISAHDMWTAAFERGVIKHSQLIEDVPVNSIMENIANKVPSMRHIVAPTGGRAQKAARGISETREHGVRMLHYIDASERAIKRNLARGMKPERALRLGFDEAAAKVQKWHPDGTGMTPFERNFMRRMFPFYSWTRKAIPLLAESMLTNPAKLTAYPKAMHDLVGSQNQQDLANPWPTDQIFPAWLREMPIGPFGSAKDGYTVVNPSNPFTDLGNQFLNSPMQGVAGMLNPLARIPAEVMSKTDLATGAPIKDWGAYADKQVPPLALVNRLGNTDIGFGSVGSLVGGGGLAPDNNTGRATGQPVNSNAIINWLTAAGLINASQPNYIKQGQYEIKDRAAQKALDARKAAGLA